METLELTKTDLTDAPSLSSSSDATTSPPLTSETSIRNSEEASESTPSPINSPSPSLITLASASPSTRSDSTAGIAQSPETSNLSLNTPAISSMATGNSGSPSTSLPRSNNWALEPSNRMIYTRPAQIPRLDNVNNPFGRTLNNFENLKSERARLDTFYGSPPPWPVAFIKPEDCASAGFFFLRDGDKVQCAFCRGVAGEWEVGDIPLAEHKRHFPRCPFVCNLPVGNIPIGQEHEAEAAGFHEEHQAPFGYDVCGPFEPTIRPNAGPDQVHVRGAQPLGGEMEDVAISLAIKTGSGPARKNLVSLQSRLKTFANWPAASNGPTPQAMAEAGFFYIGTRDHVKCFYCDGGLRNWEECDDPWSEHARWFSACPYVVLNKGPDYIKTVSEAKPPVVPSLPSTVIEKVYDSQQLPSDSGTCSAESNSEDEDQTRSESKPKPTVHSKKGGKEAQDMKEEIRKLREAKQCKICMDKELGVVFLPCGHLVSCVSCATALSTCALCRQPIKAVVRTYLS